MLRLIDGEKYSAVAEEARSWFLAARFSVTIIHAGTPEKNREIFVRMNSNSEPLKPQEIRRAACHDTPLLKSVKTLLASLDTLALNAHTAGGGRRPASGRLPFFQWLGILDTGKCKRFQDEQFLVELAVLWLHGPQHRRDTVTDRAIDSSRWEDKSTRAVAQVGSMLKGIASLPPEGGDLSDMHFDVHLEEDIYALVGAYKANFCVPRLLALRNKDISQVLTAFRLQVQRLEKKRPAGGSASSHDFAKQYKESFEGKGQINSEDRRRQRIEIVAGLLEQEVGKLDAQRLATDVMKTELWARRKHECVLCKGAKRKVTRRSFVAGHKNSWSEGGVTEIKELQIECTWCSSHRVNETKKLAFVP